MCGKSVAIPLLVAIGFVLASCARSDRASMGRVSGKVTYQGKSVAGASVAFLCPGASRPAVGMTDETGNYQLTSFEPNDGAMVGTHVVTVNKYSSEPETSVPAAEAPAGSKSTTKAIENAMRQTALQIEKMDKERPLLPRKYADRSTSDLRKAVVEGDNVIDIELSN